MTGLVLVLLFTLAEVSWSADEQKIALVRELHQVSDTKKSLDLFPDTLDVEVETDEGREVLHLVKQKSLNVRTLPVQYDDPQLNDRKWSMNREVAFYQDIENMSPMRVEAHYQDGTVKRTLTGTMVHQKRAFEVHPASTLLQSMTDILEERKLGAEHQHMVHVLKRVNLRDYLRPHKIKLTPEQEERKKELERKAKEAETLKTFLRILTDEDKAEKLETQRSRRYATHSTTVFHIEMIFVIDYSTYQFWMHELDHKEDLVHETLLHYFTQMFNGINMAFRRIDYDKHGIAIIMWLNKLHFITKAENQVAVPQQKFQGQAEEDHTFAKMEEFLVNNNYTWNNPDHAMLWTKSDMAADYSDTLGKLTVDILGVAYLCRLCHPGQSVSMNEDNGFFSWVTGAHEFGHNAGSDHDGTGGNECNADDIYIMYMSDYTLDGQVAKTAFQFSYCSVEQFKQCFTGKNPNNHAWPLVCLYDTVCDHGTPINHLDDLPGQLYNLTEQCQLFVDPAASPDKCKKENTEICEYMECYIPSEDECTAEYTEFRAAPGTPCNGSSPNAVCTGSDCACFEGRCVDTNTIKILKTEPQESCSQVKYTPPEGCTDTASKSVCDNVVINKPWRCFTSDYFSSNCRASCYTYGLFYAEEPLCALSSSDGEEPSQDTNNTSSPSSGNGTPLFCQQTLYGKEGAMTCPNNPAKCIPMSWFCDGENDCSDGSDEIEAVCIQVPCPLIEGGETYLRCKGDPAYCFKESYHNDNHNDCTDGSDEDLAWYQTAPRYCYDLFSTKKEGFNCPNNHTKCVRTDQICDGTNQCEAKDGQVGDESEEFCDSLNCMVNRLRCPNEADDHSLKCIPKRRACDGNVNCASGKDEEIEWCLSVGEEPVCDGDQTMCPGMETFKCIYESWACDTEADCDGGGDEVVSWCEQIGRTPTCQDGFIMCPDKSQQFTCVSRDSLWDNTEDCPGGEDEDLHFCLTLGCPHGQVACPGDGAVSCIPAADACNGVDNCPEAGDEDQAWCDSVKLINNCEADELLCPNADSPDDCVWLNYACDHIGDCPHDTDEDTEWCAALPASQCADDQFQCKVYKFRCVPDAYKCDGDDDCRDGSDESEDLCGNARRKELADKVLGETQRALKLLRAAEEKQRHLERRKERLSERRLSLLRDSMSGSHTPGKSVYLKKQKKSHSPVIDQARREEKETRKLMQKLLDRVAGQLEESEEEEEIEHMPLPERTLFDLKQERKKKGKIH